MHDFETTYGKITQYHPPPWSKELGNIPTHKVNLIMQMTPIHRWRIPHMPDEMQLWIKRDDMTGSALGGNKIRKLEFQFAKALKLGCGSYIKCGTLQSNECRTVAAVAAQLGLDAYLLLRKNSQVIGDAILSGNSLIMRLCGAKMIYFPDDWDYEKDIFPVKDKIAEAILQKTGKPCFNDSELFNATSIHGYLNAWEELMQQGVIDEIDDVVVPTSSGVTLGGLAVANYLTGNRVKVHGVACRKNENFFYKVVEDLLEDIDLVGVDPYDIVDVIDGYQRDDVPPGMSVKDIMNVTQEIASATGVLCDPTYGGKAIVALKHEFEGNRNRFRGKRILYIHTGGMFSVFDRDLPALKIDKSREMEWNDVKCSLMNFL